MPASRTPRLALAAGRTTGNRSAPEFDESASELLHLYSRRLDVHRRSVLLFYLLFGLIVGFCIGVAGAKGAQAAVPPGYVMNVLEEPVKAPTASHDKYASLLWYPSPVRSAEDRGKTIDTHATLGAPKGVVVTFLVAMLAMTASLSAVLLSGLKKSYRPRRAVKLGWPPS